MDHLFGLDSAKCTRWPESVVLAFEADHGAGASATSHGQGAC